MTDEIRAPVLRQISGDMRREIEAVYEAAARQIAERAKIKVREMVDALLDRHEQIVLRDLPIEEARRLVAERRLEMQEFYLARAAEIDAMVVGKCVSPATVVPTSAAVH